MPAATHPVPTPETVSTSENSWRDGVGSLIRISTLVLRQRRFVLGFPALLAVLVTVSSLLKTRTYTSSVAFVAQSSTSSATGAAALAAEVGIFLPGGDATQTPDFYARLLRSDQLLRTVVVTPFRIIDHGDTAWQSLMTIDRVNSGRGYKTDLEIEVQRFRDQLVVGTELKTGVITVAVKSFDPALSLQVVDLIVFLTNRFNVATRKTQARAERAFLESRLAQSGLEVREAENELQTFLEKNRQFAASPALSFEHDRLQRKVALVSGVFAQISQRFEQARAQEVRDTPVITIIETPKLAARPDSRGILVLVTLTLFASTFVAIVLIVGFETFRSFGSASPDETHSLASQWHDVRLHTSRVLRRAKLDSLAGVFGPGDERRS
jgi:uncharacterized protein involved in exopolysaccharide biosynthesis